MYLFTYLNNLNQIGTVSFYLFFSIIDDNGYTVNNKFVLTLKLLKH